MAKITLDVRELADRVPDVMTWLMGGDKVVLTVGGQPAFRLGLTMSPPDPTAATRPPRILGMNPGSITITPDFNDPLPEVWADGPA